MVAVAAVPMADQGDQVVEMEAEEEAAVAAAAAAAVVVATEPAFRAKAQPGRAFAQDDRDFPGVSR